MFSFSSVVKRHRPSPAESRKRTTVRQVAPPAWLRRPSAFAVRDFEQFRNILCRNFLLHPIRNVAAAFHSIRSIHKELAGLVWRSLKSLVLHAGCFDHKTCASCAIQLEMTKYSNVPDDWRQDWVTDKARSGGKWLNCCQTHPWRW